MAAQGTYPPASSPPSAGNSQSSSTHPILNQVPASSPSLISQPSHHQEGAAANNGVKEEPNVTPEVGVKQEPGVGPAGEESDIKKEPEPDNSMLDVENEEAIEKYKKYEADYACHLIAKYFSNKNIYGDDIFEANFAIDDKSIRSSRSPCTRSYTDPLQSYTLPKESISSPDTLMPGNIPNGRVMEE